MFRVARILIRSRWVYDEPGVPGYGLTMPYAPEDPGRDAPLAESGPGHGLLAT